jgi:hypothetical protein
VSTALNIPLTAVGYPVPVLTEFGKRPAGVFFTDHGDWTGAISGTPIAGSGGRYLISVFAASTSGVAARYFILTIDQAPAITSASSTTAVTGYVFSLPVTATGYPAPQITASGSLPEGVTFDSATATLGGIPGEGTSGSYPIIITAKNAAGTITQLFTLTVTTPPEPPLTHDLRGRHPLEPRMAFSNRFVTGPPATR